MNIEVGFCFHMTNVAHDMTEYDTCHMTFVS